MKWELRLVLQTRHNAVRSRLPGWEKVAYRVSRTAKTPLRIDGKENIPGKWSNNLLIP